LEGAAGVELAIGQAHHLVFAAEMKFLVLGIADRPAAAAFGQCLNGLALGERDDQFLDGDEGFGLGLIQSAHGGVPGLPEARFVGRAARKSRVGRRSDPGPCPQAL
jgi:hypothetical protein